MPALYAVCMALIMLGYVRYAQYAPNGDSISYMDISSSSLHGRWHEAVNAYWGPGYPALLAVSRFFTHLDRAREMHAYYWANYCIFIFSILCLTCMVRAFLQIRSMNEHRIGLGLNWAISNRSVYVLVYSIAWISFQNEYSVNHIMVDAFFAGLLMLAIALLTHALRTISIGPHAALGCVLGLLYLVKSPGLILGIWMITILLWIEYLHSKSLRRTCINVGISGITFLLISLFYIMSISKQMGHFTLGDSSRLNYAWQIDDTAMGHLLQNQPNRFGNSSVKLTHQEHELLSNPVVVLFQEFPHATYAPWLNPSYYDAGIYPHYSLVRLLVAYARNARKSLRLLLEYLLPAIFIFSLFYQKAFLQTSGISRNLALGLFSLAILNLLLYLPFNFLPRYTAAALWILFSALIAFTELPSGDVERARNWLGGAIFIFSFAVMVMGMQQVFSMRQDDIGQRQNKPGWHDDTQSEIAMHLQNLGIKKHGSIACFQCFNGDIWARLASVHITAEIYDTRYMTDASHPGQEWRSLPNKPAILESLHAVGIAGIVGRFNTQPIQDPALAETWQQLAGNYYWLSTQTPEARTPVKQTPATPQPAAR